MPKKIKDLKGHAQMALEWIKTNTIAEKGIVVSSKKKIPYLEVTGYLIPTLIDLKEFRLARQYAEFLLYMQRPNGAFFGPDGKEYFFDSGQALRGLTAAALVWDEFKAPALKTADFLVSQINHNGQVVFTYEDNIPEFVHLYVLPAVAEAGSVFHRGDYLKTARKSLQYYKQQPTILSDTYLTHFLAYVLDGLIDLGEAEFVRPFVKKLFLTQKKDGAIKAFNKVSWVCSVGLAQLAIVAYKLNMIKEADAALEYVASLQNPTGGFFGSYGFGAKYFSKEEISWANKFFLDAVNWKQKVYKNDNLTGGFGEKRVPLNHDEWHEAITAGQTVEEITERLKNNNFPVWCRPLLTHTSPNDVVLELGSGTGELSAILRMYERRVHLLDFSAQSIEFSKKLFKALKLDADYHCQDIFRGILLKPRSVDWVFSSGVLEHFTDDQMVQILKDSKNVSRKGVMSLVPNANALFYRIGKFKMEEQGKWKYGREVPKMTMRPLFEAAGLKDIQEYSVGTYHSLQFWGAKFPTVKAFLDQLDLNELRALNQGYLLFTIGKT